MINLHVTRKRMKLRHMIAAQKGFENDLEGMAYFIARFVVDDKGEYMPKEQAFELVADLDGDEIIEVTKALTSQIREMQKSAVPLATETTS